jgi:hypothetical protein
VLAIGRSATISRRKKRRLILTLAREAEPHVYWVNWVCSFLGRELQR